MALGWQISIVTCWLFSLLVVFLLLGALRRLDRLSWQLDQLRATTPRRLGRDGLSVGRKVPDFTLPSVAGGDVSLSDYLGKRLLLVFTQEGCSPCRELAPVLNKMHGSELQVVNVYNSKLDRARAWAKAESIQFPVLVQEGLAVSKRFEAYATPFAFLVNEQGFVAAKGVVNTSQHIEFLLSDAHMWENRKVESKPKSDESLPADDEELPELQAHQTLTANDNGNSLHRALHGDSR